jgi:hypothetical protein
MRFRPLFGLFALGLFALVARAEDKPAIRVISLKDVKLKAEDKFGRPVIIESADALAKSKVFEDDASREAVKKQIDFSKEKLVVWVATVASDTKLSVEFDKDKEKGLVVLLISDVGVKKDMKEQRLAVAIPKDAKTVNAAR